MRNLIPVMGFLIITTANAVEISAVEADGATAERSVCKITVNNVGESMPAGAYQGQCVSGKPDGMGQVVFSNGDRFAGGFKNGRINGTGTWTSGSSGNSYSGNWRDGKRDGTGTYNWARSNQQYVGAWAGDKREGQGTLTWGNGNRFEGEFRNNQQYNGTLYSADGSRHTCFMGSCR